MQLAHLDRKGRYAGDQIESRVSGTGATYRGDGVIGNSAETSAFTDEITTAKGFVDVPDATIVLGNSAFYMSMGFDIPATKSTKANVIVVTTADGAAQALVTDEVAYAEMFDAAIDGVADAGAGRVRALSGTGATAISGFAQNGSARIVSGANEVSTGGTAWSTGHSGVIYYFDRDPNAL